MSRIKEEVWKLMEKHADRRLVKMAGLGQFRAKCIRETEGKRESITGRKAWGPTGDLDGSGILHFVQDDTLNTRWIHLPWNRFNRRQRRC